LAEKWESSPDGKKWTFLLRKDLKWSDGSPLTIRDIIFSFREILFNPNLPTPYRDIFNFRTGRIEIRQAGPRSIEFSLPEPFAPFLTTLSAPLVPESSFNNLDLFLSQWNLSTPPTEIIGSGPFRLVHYDWGKELVYEANPFYYGKKEPDPFPAIDGLRLRIHRSRDLAILDYKGGELDALSLDFQEIEYFRGRIKDEDLIIQIPGETGVEFLAFNQRQTGKHAYFRNYQFRKAIALAIDREKMIRLLFDGRGKLSHGPWSERYPRFLEKNTKQYLYHPEEARRLLDNLGLKDTDGDRFREDDSGKRIEITILTNADNRIRMDSAGLIRNDLANIGLSTQVKGLAFGALTERLMKSSEWEIIYLGFTLSPDPHFSRNVWHSKGTLHFWEDPEEGVSKKQQEIDEIFNRAHAILDTSKRIELYRKWQRLTQEELPVVFLIYPLTSVITSPRLEGVNWEEGVLDSFKTIRFKKQ